MPGAITLSVRDELSGTPAAGVRVQVYWVEPQTEVLLRAATTRDDGTTDKPLVSGSKLSAGVYRVVLHAGDYFQQTRPDAPRSLDVVPVVFVVEDAAAGRAVRVTLGATSYAVSCV